MREQAKLIVALDVNNIETLGGLIDQLRAQIKIFKIGMKAHTACGTEARELMRLSTSMTRPLRKKLSPLSDPPQPRKSEAMVKYPRLAK